MVHRIVCLLLLILFAVPAGADDLTDAQKQNLLAEHLFQGKPSDHPALVRRGYIISFDADRRVPS